MDGVRCGYSIDNFDPNTYQGILQGVSRAHSHLVPVEDYARLERAVERAYAEVFGVGATQVFCVGRFSPTTRDRP